MPVLWRILRTDSSDSVALSIHLIWTLVFFWYDNKMTKAQKGGHYNEVKAEEADTEIGWGGHSREEQHRSINSTSFNDAPWQDVNTAYQHPLPLRPPQREVGLEPLRSSAPVSPISARGEEDMHKDEEEHISSPGVRGEDVQTSQRQFSWE